MSKNETAMTLSEVTRILNSDAWQSVIEEKWSGYEICPKVGDGRHQAAA